jgi:Domain of Unknown Function with PDB structure (DUF3857)
VSLRCPIVLPCLTALAVLACAPHLLGAEDSQAITAAELSMTSEPLAQGAPAIILYRQVDRDDSGSNSHETNFIRIKILKEEGRKRGDIEIPFFKGSGTNIRSIKARTIQPDGSVVNFEGRPFDRYIVKAKGLKYMAKTLTLPNVQVGSIIEYSYTLDLPEDFVFDSHWILSEELFTKRARFSLKPYSGGYVIRNLRWSWHLLPEGTDPPKAGPDHIVRLEANNIPAFQIEDFMPPEDELKARVDFTYAYDRQMDDVQFWKDWGKRFNGYLETFIGKRKTMDEASSGIVSPNDTPAVKIEKIYARVQQIRNLSWEQQRTAQEEKRERLKQINNVEDVWRRGYGNAWQINWLFLALSRSAGFEAYGVWVSDRQQYFFNPKLMDPHKLDRSVVLIKLNGKDIYCDPGAALTPFGLLPWSETGVTGLRLDQNGGTWIRTLVPQSSDSRTVRKADLTLSDIGDLEGKVTITFTGLEALWWRVEERNEDEADRKKALEDETKAYIPAASEVELTNKPDWSSSSTPLIAELRMKIPGWASNAGRRALLPVGIFSATEKQVFEREQRVHPIYFAFPFQKEDDVTITLPAAWAVSSLPKEQIHDVKAAVYSLNVENGKSRLHLARRVKVDVWMLDQDSYPVLRNFFQVVRAGDEEQVVLQPEKASASN